jgi:signal transduction histidine kinase
MWLRLALNTLLALLIFSACSSPDRQAVDKLNSLSYAYHYRHIDSTELFAQRAYDAAKGYDAGRAEALNNKAFVSIVRMDYDKAEQQLNEALSVTDNQIELYIAEVQLMRLCQRRSDNRAFYEHRERAESHLLRIREERDELPERLQRRMNYAETEMAIVNSTYYYYVGLERQSVEAIQTMDVEAARRDTAQYLNYLYNVGAGGILTEGSAEQIRADEIECLERCLSIADRCHYPYFKAQALEGLADHTGSLELAEEALRLFTAYGDVYQIAGAYRTLASCYHAMGDNYQALDNLNKALADQRINQAPDLVASIREQLSVAYSAVDDKKQSDYNRNIYIDLQEQTRQDRELEARAGILDREATQLNWMILAVLVAIILLLFFLWLFNRLNRRQQDDHQLDDVLEQKQEEVAEARLRVERNERRHLEQRAKISLAMGILPLIDRIRHEVNHLESLEKLENLEKLESLDYIRELTDNINEQNEVLTQWIQLRQGELSMHVESFPLQALFDIVARSKKTFQMKGVDLRVSPTDASVKADRVLTLFMLNTLADNARKFTPDGGHVDISATESENYVEVSVADSGCGMSADALAHVFDHKVQQGHGFGLMNCKGIIEKYRKTSQLFSVCSLQAESEEGRGSRFFFRLPKGVVRLLVVVMGLIGLMGHTDVCAQSALDRAHIFADSAYFSNINGTYARTLVFADSCRACLNAHYLQQQPKGQLLLQAESDDASPAEIEWLHGGIDTNYQIILDIRNESAVAALALHEWSLYAYNNKVYTQLFKELSADATLSDYCRTMQQSQQNKRIAVILLLVLLVLIVPAYYMLYYRHRLYQRFRQERQQQTNIEMADDELRRAELENANLHVANSVLDNCLSTLKHETMYYPSRIRQLVDAGDMQSLAEVASYYRDLYSILIQQATSQVERIKLHVHPVELYGQKVLGDENLLHYLFELLKTKEVTAEVKDDKYVDFHATLNAPLSTLNFMMARQIVRDHGEATARRGCGIVIDNNLVNITLPRHNGKL